MRTLQTAFSFLLPLVALPAQWGAVTATNAPAPREEPLLAYDLAGTRTLMFGGNFTNEFWSLSGGTWTQLAPAVLPGARRRMNISTDILSGEIWMYGGQDGTQTTALDETWRWDGVGWQQLSPSVSPGGRIWHGQAFDSNRQVTVLFGGRRDLFNQTQVLDETWEFNATQGTWFQTGGAGPQGLLKPAMCHHPALGKVVLFGGEIAGGGASNETWTFDGSTWQQINVTGLRPPPRSGGQMLPVLTRGIVVLFGGRDPVTFEILNDTWEHDGVSWRKIDNVYGGIYPARAEFGMTHDLARDRLVAFGGKTANGALRDDTWEYGAQWQPFGIGCAGTAGVPTFTGIDLPRLGATATAEVGNVPPGIPFAFVAVGISRTQWALGSLPTLLTGFGMPGCRTYTSADLFAYAPAQNGVATWSWAVPNVPAFVGEPFHLQGITFDPGANALGLAVSNAATMVVGN